MKIGIVGYGNIGQALHQKYLVPFGSEHTWTVLEMFDVTVFDVDPFKNCRPIDDPKLNEMELIVCGAPASQTKYWIDFAVRNKQHFIGFTEDVEVTRYAKGVARSDRAMIPQCGIAPGIVNIIADSYARSFNDVQDIKIRVGALPRSTLNDYRYAFTWSPEGVINEYKKPCSAIIDGVLYSDLPGTTDYEHLIIDGFEYEAFLTSGGIGSLCDTYVGNAKNVDYKTVRYIGHHDAINNGQDITECPTLISNDDMVVLHISVTGRNNGSTVKQLSYTKKIYGDEAFSAIQSTTAMGAYIWILALLSNPNITGYIKQEQYNDFSTKRADRLFE